MDVEEEETGGGEATLGFPISPILDNKSSVGRQTGSAAADTLEMEPPTNNNNTTHHQQQSTTERTVITPPPLVPSDAPIALIHSRHTDSQSSLSGDEDEEGNNNTTNNNDREREQQEQQQQHSNDTNNNKQPIRNLPRINSRESSSGFAGSSHTSSRDWGWFDPEDGSKQPLQDTTTMAVTAPTYVLAESISSQNLWKKSAGQRPPQPVEERVFFEKMWLQNFEKSKVNYTQPIDVLTATTPVSIDPFSDNFEISVKQPSDVVDAAIVHRMETKVQEPTKDTVVDPTFGQLRVIIEGDNVFGTTVSKSFTRATPTGNVVNTINISIARYRVVESSKHGKYAQFLVIYREGGVRDTIGIWKRYSDFEELAAKVTQSSEGNCVAVIANISPLHISEEPETEHLPNAITSWRLLKKRKRWYRCLDASYLSLKVFLLERFLHDILFESSSPTLLAEFCRVDEEAPSQ